MSSEENIIAVPADNSIASESISAKLIEVSRVAESLDTVLHQTQDGLNIYENTMSGSGVESSSSTASVIDRKAGNTSDVRFLLLSEALKLIQLKYCFRIGTQVSSRQQKTNLS